MAFFDDSKHHMIEVTHADGRSDKKCSVYGCGKTVRTKGYCNSHYLRLWRHGDPLMGRTQAGTPMRFIHEVAVLHTSDECLIWPFGRFGNGYGQANVEGKKITVSRYICELVHGAPPTPKHDAAHSCGNGHDGCISPIHLSWKTRTENNADKLVHGTHNRGERSPMAKLTEAEVREIVSLKGVESKTNMAMRLGVSKATIADIHTGRTWAWLSEDAREMK